MYFTFKGKSSEDMNIRIIDFSPPGKAEEVTETISIPGRSKDLIKITGRHKNHSSNLKFAVFGRKSYRAVLDWLSGSGRLIFSSEPDKYYNVYMTGAVAESRISDDVSELSVSVVFEPFAYSVSNPEIAFTASYTSIPNNGTEYSEPVIKLKISAESAPILKGDVNFDGTIDATDASLVMSEYTNIATGGTPTFTDAQREAADMDGDGFVDMWDAGKIMEIYANNQTSGNSTSSAPIEKQVQIVTNGETLTIGLPGAVVRSSLEVTIDSENNVIYYTDASGKKINILQHSSGDFPLLHTGKNYIKYIGNIDLAEITVNERWK